MNATIAVYAAETITMSLSKTFVWTSNAAPYPYTTDDLTDAGKILTRFGERIKNNLTGNLAHFITTVNTGQTLGIAWTDVLCFAYNGVPQHAGPYGVTADLGTSQAFPDNSQDVVTFAHELGHNIGSPHTHDCEWGPNNLAIDNCVATEANNCGLVTPLEQTGTIMSYCNNALLSKGFGELPGALIRTKYNNAKCISVTPPICPADISVSSATTTGNSLGSNSVSTAGPVTVNGAAVFSSNNINLNAGFEVPSGSCFEANNVGCGYTGVITCEGGGSNTGADGSCNAPHVLTCGQNFMGDNNSSGTNIWTTYNNSTFDYPSIEKVHTISIPANNTAKIDMTGMTDDLDLFGGTSCNNNSLTFDSSTEGNETFNLVNNSGSALVYYIIVDGYDGATSEYTLSVTCTPNS
ncbi:MAG: hypothetical protein ACJA01_001350 [Saprospiraceae bacterium]|jgi:hypothetical protein